ncbi:VOC family protein [Paenibacillus sacheonensis]|uniref:Glyoxalase n=1 Tax=Paenibacillus sacheonensis TaxID=742054 RepID=A0A7X4YUJ4_9BACL|nr:VOC family protein [Paenibacillus sacheonensis]MBM7569104.1 putative glyoxalase superfamily protein PhnB [Paenibacillus sacheonensis]NBC72718.1 glyoxalase [Paenibacillus sacheonensis]
MTVQLKRVGIYVEQMEKALKFYRMLGLTIPVSANVGHHVEVEQNGLRFAFDTIDSVKGVFEGWETPVGYRIELAFQLDSREALDEVYRQLTVLGQGGYLEPRDMPWGERYAIVKDPDGNLISLVA